MSIHIFIDDIYCGYNLKIFQTQQYMVWIQEKKFNYKTYCQFLMFPGVGCFLCHCNVSQQSTFYYLGALWRYLIAYSLIHLMKFRLKERKQFIITIQCDFVEMWSCTASQWLILCVLWFVLFLCIVIMTCFISHCFVTLFFLDTKCTCMCVCMYVDICYFKRDSDLWG
jgi:hypothetical protein